MNSRALVPVLALALAMTLSMKASSQEALPKPDPEFKGKIGETYRDSTPNFPLPLTAAKGIPTFC
jgi:arylsulfatase